MLVTGPAAAQTTPTANADGSYTVPDDWALKPTGFGGGTKFRLLFITDVHRNAVPGDIGQYDTFVQQRAVAGHAAIRPYASLFKVFGSTQSVNARDHVGATGTDVLIYWLNGTKIADHYMDFLDGSWDANASSDRRNGKGQASNTATRTDWPWTGSNQDGTKSASPLGTPTPTRGAFGSGNPIAHHVGSNALEDHAFYALSPVFVVALALVDLSVSGGGAAAEGGSALTITATLSSANMSGSALAIPIRVRTTGTSAQGADYMLASPISIPNNDSSGTTTFTVVDDIDDELDETVVVELGTLPAGTAPGADSAVTITIADNDVPVVTPTADSTTATEGDTLSFTVSADISPVADLAVNLHVIDEADFVASDDEGDKSVTIPAGATSVKYTVPTVNDEVDERLGFVRVQVTAGEDYTPVGGVGATVTVADNDDPAVSFDAESYGVAEGGAVTVTLNVVLPRAAATTVGIVCTGGTDGSADYVCPPSVTVPVNARTHSFEITTTADSEAEGDETFTVAIDSVPSGARIGSPSSTTVTIVSRDRCTNCFWILGGSPVTEGGDARFTVYANPAPTEGKLVVRLAVLDATESPISNFIALDDERVVALTIQPGHASATLAVPTVDDSTYEPDGTVTARLLHSGSVLEGTNRTYYRWFGPTEVSVTVRDDDTAPAAHVPPAVTVSTQFDELSSAENVGTGGLASFCFVVGGTETDPFTGAGSVPPTMPARFNVNYEITSSTGKLTFETGRVYENGRMYGALTVQSAGRLKKCGSWIRTGDEIGATLTARVLPSHTKSYGTGTGTGIPTYAVGTPSTATITLVKPTDSPPVVPPDGQLSTVTISADRTSVTEGGDVTFTVTADPAPAGDLEVTVSADEEMGSGDDLVGSGHFGRVTIWAGVTSATWTVETWSDDDDLADGTVVGRIEAGDGYTVGDPSSVTVALLDDDGVVPQGVPDSVVGDPATPGVDPALVARVRGYAAETHQGQAHVDRWKRVLAAFGDDNGHTAMTAAEAQTHADRGWQRWVPVVAALEALEAAPEPPQQQVVTLPAVTIAAGTSPVTEGGDAAFTLTATPAPASPLAVTVTVATEGDFGVAAGSRTVKVPTTGSATLTLATANDGDDEADGSVSVTVDAGDGYAAGDPATAAVAVTDDDEPRLPALSVADVEVEESGGAFMTFAVRLSAPAADTVTVRAATRDSTPASATAGKDYWPVDAELRFRAGETERRVGVVVFDDDHDEGSETFELALSDARGATVGDGVAVGTIANDDPLPAAWLARFGRGVAERALEGVSDRLDAPRGAQGLRGTVAGVPLGFGVPGGAARPAPGPAPGEYGGGASFPSGSGLGPLSGSRLSWGGAEDAGGGTLGLWGRASRSRFDGREGALALDGETATTLLGADYARGRWLAGVALARSRGEGAYRAAGAAAGDCAGGDAERGACMAAAGGAVSSSLTAAIPYASLRASGRLRLWGAAGAGAGEVSLATAAGGIHAAATSWRMAAAGLRGDLLGGGAGPALAVVSDALWTRAASAAARGLAASDSGASRLRLGLEGRWELPVPGGGRLTPSLEAGARRDGGDAETGFGVELGGGLAWRQPSLGIALDLSGRTLVSHEDGAAAEQGLSASLAYDPTPASARGLSLSLRQHRGGQAAGGLDALFAGDPLARRLEGGRDADAGRWTMEAGWGVSAFGGRFVGTPHVGVSASAFGRDLSVGWRLAPETAAAPGPSLGVEAARREGGAAGAEHGVRIEVSAQW